MTTRTRVVREFGDFQTPLGLAELVCQRLTELGVSPDVILEPTCGQGTFLEAAVGLFGRQVTLNGYELNRNYVSQAERRLAELGAPNARVTAENFFSVDWNRVVESITGSVLFLGNPPWVTNAALGVLQSDNLPRKSNVNGLSGSDARTGKSNFDISEWMIQRMLDALAIRGGWIAMIVKTAVARKVISHQWQHRRPIAFAAMYGIDARVWFGAATSACLFVLQLKNGSEPTLTCPMYSDLSGREQTGLLGLLDGRVVPDVREAARSAAYVGACSLDWRSGVKHDCAEVMELSLQDDGSFTNGLGESIRLETNRLFPLVKSTDLSKGRVTGVQKFMLVPQDALGAATAHLELSCPRTFEYLRRHRERLAARASSIYRGQPEFSVFGVGEYTFSAYKVAVSALHKSPVFRVLGPQDGRPLVTDDTCLMAACRSEAHASLAAHLLNDRTVADLLRSTTFSDDKRPFKVGTLRRIDLEKVAASLGLGEQWADAAGLVARPQRSLW